MRSKLFNLSITQIVNHHGIWLTFYKNAWKKFVNNQSSLHMINCSLCARIDVAPKWSEESAFWCTHSGPRWKEKTKKLEKMYFWWVTDCKRSGNEQFFTADSLKNLRSTGPYSACQKLFYSKRIKTTMVTASLQVSPTRFQHPLIVLALATEALSASKSTMLML